MSICSKCRPFGDIVARPPIERLVAGLPRVTLFKPAGVPARELEQTQLGVDEFEAMRLVDGEGLSHEQAAELMGVSRQTVGRVLETGRKKLIHALAAGQAVLIGGGQYRVGGRWRCSSCDVVFDTVSSAESVTCPACGSTDVGPCMGPGRGCGRGPGRGRGYGRHGQGRGGGCEGRGRSW